MASIKHHAQEGQRFGRGTVIDPEIRVTSSGGKTHRGCRLRCDCGTIYEAVLFQLTSGKTSSCGCASTRGKLAGTITEGQRFGSMTVTEPDAGRHPAGHRLARLRCDCGAETVVTYSQLVSGATLSCGCGTGTARSTHRLSKHPLYPTWQGMMTRCYNPRQRHYARYGGRGISVCPRWHNPAAFIEDIERLIGPRPEGMTLDRKRNGIGYKPSNVRWASEYQQKDNRTFNGITPQERMARRERVFSQWMPDKSQGPAAVARALGITRKQAEADLGWIKRRLALIEAARTQEATVDTPSPQGQP